MQSRAALGLTLLLLLVVLASGTWLWSRLVDGAPLTTPPTELAAATATPAATGTPTPLRAPPGYRLAGVAVGEPESFAVIESPDGATTLYRTDADVPGLGKLIRIEAERVLMRGTSGEFELWLAPAATATPTRVRTAAHPTATPVRRSSPAGGTTRAPTP